jgi:NAD-specific glutamate dehydrogenase
LPDSTATMLAEIGDCPGALPDLPRARHCRGGLGLRPGAAALSEALPDLLIGLDGDTWHARVAEFADPGVPRRLAPRVASIDAMFFALDIDESVCGTDQPVRRAGSLHVGLDRQL